MLRHEEVTQIVMTLINENNHDTFNAKLFITTYTVDCHKCGEHSALTWDGLFRMLGEVMKEEYFNKRFELTIK